jgi:hypothetical protein
MFFRVKRQILRKVLLRFEMFLFAREVIFILWILHYLLVDFTGENTVVSVEYRHPQNDYTHVDGGYVTHPILLFKLL